MKAFQADPKRLSDLTMPHQCCQDAIYEGIVLESFFGLILHDP